MEALTLMQPFASLLAAGQKRVETRSWQYRGDLPAIIAIHASAKLDRKMLNALVHGPDGAHFRAALSQLGCTIRQFEKSGIYGCSFDALPTGSVIAIARLVSCVSTVALTSELAWKGLLNARERAFGDFTAGRYGWVFDRVNLLEKPIEARGKLMVWNWDAPADLVAWGEESIRELLHAKEVQR